MIECTREYRVQVYFAGTRISSEDELHLARKGFPSPGAQENLTTCSWRPEFTLFPSMHSYIL